MIHFSAESVSEQEPNCIHQVIVLGLPPCGMIADDGNALRAQLENSLAAIAVGLLDQVRLYIRQNLAQE